MNTFTDKELIKEIKERIGSLDVRDNIERRAYEIALASLGAEPVAYQYRQGGMGRLRGMCFRMVCRGRETPWGRRSDP